MKKKLTGIQLLRKIFWNLAASPHSTPLKAPSSATVKLFSFPELREAFLLMLCRTERTEELVPLLEITDIAKFSSSDAVARIVKYLGRHQLESLAEKVLLDFKACESATGNISDMICSYVLGIPNLTAEDVISKDKNLR